MWKKEGRKEKRVRLCRILQVSLTKKRFTLDWEEVYYFHIYKKIKERHCLYVNSFSNLARVLPLAGISEVEGSRGKFASQLFSLSFNVIFYHTGIIQNLLSNREGNGYISNLLFFVFARITIEMWAGLFSLSMWKIMLS